MKWSHYIRRRLGSQPARPLHSNTILQVQLEIGFISTTSKPRKREGIGDQLSFAFLPLVRRWRVHIQI